MTIERSFMGLADRTRLRIVNLLLGGELCGCDIEHVLAVSQSNVSRHLTYLKRNGLVLDRRQGYRVFYRLAERQGTSDALLFDYLRHVFASEKSFNADLKALRVAIRHGACTMSESGHVQALKRSTDGRPRGAKR